MLSKKAKTVVYALIALLSFGMMTAGTLSLISYVFRNYAYHASIALIVGVALVMTVINIIAKTSFFGLGFYGNHNIYNVVLFKNGIVSALAYFAGLVAVLVLGYFYQLIIKKLQR